MGVYLGHQPRDNDEDAVSQHQIEVMNNELDEMYVLVENMMKQLKQNTRVINNMMECIAQFHGKPVGSIFYDYPMKNHLGRKKL